ncbi:MAG TPA: zinc-ribbon and DUF3426 domain-containing protein [Burkholderiales bacterium]|nr:zinc-ribbon and DUF3426 domain-containing protein [Burkholderiales bacterium]
MNELVTRCPTCGTAFRALPTQLSARSGMVRCGKCAGVFDALANLVEDAPEASPAEPSPQLGLFDAGARGAPSVPGGAGRPRTRRRPYADDEPLPQFLEEEAPRSRFNVAWGLAAFLALVALLLQLAYQYRTELATLAPQAKPYLVEGCRFVECEVRLPRRPDLLSIESSDLQADKRGESLIVLHAVIRNRAPFPQELPALELTLTDSLDRAVVRRVLSPDEYLPARARGPGEGNIAPGAEATLRVLFDTGGVGATGYRLYLFYPT